MSGELDIRSLSVTAAAKLLRMLAEPLPVLMRRARSEEDRYDVQEREYPESQGVIVYGEINAIGRHPHPEQPQVAPHGKYGPHDVPKARF